MKKNILFKLFCLLSVTFLTTVELNAQQAKSFPFTTDTPMVHDPVMAFENGRYYLYCTGMGIQQMSSSDLRSWNVERDCVLVDIPLWTHDSVPGFESHIWAPDVIKYKGKWYMAYSCSTFGKNTSAIGLLSNTSLADKKVWKDEGCIVASHEKDNYNAIDPNFVIDYEDQLWLTFGSFWDGIQMVRLDSTMHVMKGEKPKTIARRHPVGFTSAESNPTSQFAGPNAIEAPFIFRHSGYYYLFVSWDYCCRGMNSNYRVAVGRSRNVNGPYVDRNGRDMLDGGGELIIEGDKKEYEAMGHCAVYNINDKDIFICHGYSVKQNGAPILVVKQIKWDNAGWPEIKDIEI